MLRLLDDLNEDSKLGMFRILNILQNFLFYVHDIIGLNKFPNLPLFGPGAVTTTIGLVVSIYGFAPYPSSLTIVSTSDGYPLVGACL